MKFSFAGVVGTVALAAGLSAPASATVTDLGAIAIGVPTPFNGVAAPGPFGDVFTFTLPANGGSGYSVTNFALSGPFGSFNTLFSTLTLVSNPDGILFNADDTVLTQSSGSSVASLSLSFGATAAGPYYLSVQGLTNGSLGGLYNGAISVSPIPEAQTYAMMLAGLAAIGFVAARRRPRA